MYCSAGSVSGSVSASGLKPKQWNGRCQLQLHTYFFNCTVQIALLLAFTIKKSVINAHYKQYKLLYCTHNNIKIIIISESDALHIKKILHNKQ